MKSNDAFALAEAKTGGLGVSFTHIPPVFSIMVHFGLKNKSFGLVASTEIPQMFLNAHP